MSKRKTIPVEKVKEIANQFLANSSNNEYMNSDVRAGVAVLLERILFETKNYAGFNYVKWSKEGGFEDWVKDGEPNNKDEYLGDPSRRVYY